MKFCLRLDTPCSPEEAASCGWCDTTPPVGFVETKEGRPRKRRRKPKADTVKMGWGSERMNKRAKAESGRRTHR